MKMDLNVTYMVHILLKYFRFCFSTPYGQTKIGMSYAFFFFFFIFSPVKQKLNMEFFICFFSDFSVEPNIEKRNPRFPISLCHIPDFFIIIICPLTARVVRAPQMISQPVFSIFPCSPLPSGTWRTPGLSIH